MQDISKQLGDTWGYSLQTWEKYGWVQPTTGHPTWLGNPWKSSINGHCNGKIMENHPTKKWFFFQQTMAMSFPWNLLVMRFSMESTYNPKKTNRVEVFHGFFAMFSLCWYTNPLVSCMGCIGKVWVLKPGASSGEDQTGLWFYIVVNYHKHGKNTNFKWP